jgi:4a-hydroxytetrahydrobiopterin dehydratase
MKALTGDKVSEFLEREPEWRFAQGKFTREWKFPDFVRAMAFVNRVATLAEEAGHHPDIDIRYDKVMLGLVTHDAGGVTERDAQMAARLSREFASA